VALLPLVLLLGAAQLPGQPKVTPGPNEPDWVVLLDGQYGLKMFDDLANPVSTTVDAVKGRFRKAGPGPVVYRPLIALGLETPTRAGWYRPVKAGEKPKREPLWSYQFKNTAKDIETGDRLPPPLLEGSKTEFDPGDGAFGLWVGNDQFDDGGVYTEPAVVRTVNARVGAQPYKAMIYPFRDKATGQVVPHSYLIGWEYSTNDDFQDVVCRVDNVELLAPEDHQASQTPRPPNIVMIFADDLAYADIGPFGATGYATPNLDRMAQEGRRFTSFYVPQAVCSASRTALLTGCYPNRVGILGALGPNSKIGIHDDERLMSEALRARGYATAAVGKWHLGHLRQFLPTHHGFDSYFGLPYSNDMWPRHPENPKAYPPLPLIEGDQTLELSPDQTQLTTRYTEHAVKFIEASKDRPFFLYLAHSMPHVPLHVSDKYAGKTPRGLFGDVIEEIDWSVGQVLATIKRLGLDDNTLVVFTADNGPWLSYGDHAGSAGPLREGKGTEFDGGVREPFVVRWPGHVPAGTSCDEPVMTIDLLPTFAALAGNTETPPRPIDGLDIRSLILGEPGAKTPHEALAFYWGKELHAVRSGKWKLHFPHPYRTLVNAGSGGVPGKYKQTTIGLSLFDLDSDIGESRDVAAEHPEVVSQLTQHAERFRADLGDSLTDRTGPGVREPGKVAEQP
jgi:arylsulfatase A-like enzyme